MAAPLSIRMALHHARRGGSAWQTARHFGINHAETKALLGAFLRVSAGAPGAGNARNVIARFDKKWVGR
jgi:hypothetical protein